jgi:hypothetical protein
MAARLAPELNDGQFWATVHALSTSHIAFGRTALWTQNSGWLGRFRHATDSGPEAISSSVGKDP